MRDIWWTIGLFFTIGLNPVIILNVFHQGFSLKKSWKEVNQRLQFKFLFLKLVQCECKSLALPFDMTNWVRGVSSVISRKKYVIF